MNKSVGYIKPIKTFTDKKGTWWIEFKQEDLKKLLESKPLERCTKVLVKSEKV